MELFLEGPQNAVRQEQDHQNGDQAQNDIGVTGITGQHLFQHRVNDGAQDGTAHSADAADNDDEHDGYRPVDAEASAGIDAALVQIEHPAGQSGKKAADDKAQQLRLEDIHTHAGSRVRVVPHGGEAQADLGAQQQVDDYQGDDAQHQSDHIDLGRAGIRLGLDRHARTLLDEGPAGEKGLEGLGHDPGGDGEIHAAHPEQEHGQPQGQGRAQHAAYGKARPVGGAVGEGHDRQGISGDPDKGLLA